MKHQDKLLHFLGGAVIEAAALLFGIPYYKGLGAVALLAGVKELYDRLHPLRHTADWLDFLATVLGGAVVALAAYLLKG